MRPIKLKESIKHAIKHNLPLLIKGAPGVGKTDIMKQACKETDTELIISHPVVSDPTDYKGLPFPNPDGKEAHFLPFGELNKLLQADKPTVFFMDDLGQASISVQAAAMQLILGRQINGFNVSDHVVFMAATNRRQDKAGVAGILEPVKSRFASIIELTPTHEDWIQWALKEGVNERVIAFVKTKPDILFAFEATSDLVNTPSPRTIVNASKIIDTVKDDLILRDELVAGAAGEGFAAEYAAYERVYDKIPSIDEIMHDPENAIIPEGHHLDRLFAISVMCSNYMNAENYEQLYKYVSRLPRDFEFAVHTDASYRDNSIIDDSLGFLKWIKNNKDLIA